MYTKVNQQHYSFDYLINTFLVPDIHLGVILLPLSRLSLMLQCRLCCSKVPRRLHDVLRDVWVDVSESAQSEHGLLSYWHTSVHHCSLQRCSNIIYRLHSE